MRKIFYKNKTFFMFVMPNAIINEVSLLKLLLERRSFEELSRFKYKIEIMYHRKVVLFHLSCHKVINCFVWVSNNRKERVLCNRLVTLCRDVY